MKFILSEALSQEEERQLKGILADRGYSKSEIEDTIKLTRRDARQAAGYREKVLNKLDNNEIPDGTSNKQGTDNSVNTQTNSEGVNNTPQDRNASEEETQPGMTVQVQTLYNALQSTKAGKKAWEMYKNGAKDWALDKDFPFYKLMNSTNFRKAIGINESLKEGAWSDLGSTIISNAVQKKMASKVEVPRNFLNAYNTVIEFNNDTMNKYLSAAKDSSVLYDPNFYKMSDKDQMKRALNIDIAVTANNDADGKKELLNAIKSNKVSELSTYDLNGGQKSSSKVDVNGFIKAFENAPKDSQKQVLDKLSKIFNGS